MTNTKSNKIIAVILTAFVMLGIVGFTQGNVKAKNYKPAIRYVNYSKSDKRLHVGWKTPPKKHYKDRVMLVCTYSKPVATYNSNTKSTGHRFVTKETASYGDGKTYFKTCGIKPKNVRIYFCNSSRGNRYYPVNTYQTSAWSDIWSKIGTVK